MKTKTHTAKSYSSYALLYFFYFFGMGIFVSILSIYLAGGGKNNAEIALIVSASGVFSMALQPFISYLYDKTQRERTVSIILLLISGICGLLFALIAFLFNGCASSNTTCLSLLLQDLLGSTTQVGTLLFLGTMMEISIILFSNRFMDKLDGKTLLHIDFGLLIVQFLIYSFVRNIFVVGFVLFLCKSTATMLFIMVTLKIVLNLVEPSCSTTAMSVAATAKAMGGVVVPILAGFVSKQFGRTSVFMLLLGVAATGFILSQFLQMNKDTQPLF